MIKKHKNINNKDYNKINHKALLNQNDFYST